MRKVSFILLSAVFFFGEAINANAQYKKGKEVEKKTEGQILLEKAENSDSTLIITLEEALKIALSENTSIKVADKEIEKQGYAKQGSYSALYPQINAVGNYQRSIKKQVMYMDMPGASGDASGDADASAGGDTGAAGAASGMSSMKNGIEVGRDNTLNAGVTANWSIINAQVWKGIEISGLSVDLAVEKARGSRIDMVTEVKKAYYSVLLSKEAFDVYKEVYENALKNLKEVEKKYKVQKVSELEYLRSKTTVSNAIPNVYNAESTIILAQWQLKALLGVNLDLNIDVSGTLEDYTQEMFRDINEVDSLDIANNSSLKQLAIQAEQLAESIKLQKYAYIPTLAATFSYTTNAMENNFNFKEFRWTPHSYVGISLSIPIFSGFKRYNDVRQAKTQHEQVKLQTVDVERNLKIAITHSLTTMETNMKTYYAAKESVKMAQKGYDIAEKSYEVGRSTLMELNDAQLALTQARLGMSQAVFNFVTAKTQLEQTLGQDFVVEDDKIIENK